MVFMATLMITGFTQKKLTEDNAVNMIMGDGKLTDDMSRNDFANSLINDETQAFQIMGEDKLGGMKLATVVKNSETGVVTMYTCDSKECYPMVIPGSVDLKKVASALTDNLTAIQGITVWEE